MAVFTLNSIRHFFSCSFFLLLDFTCHFVAILDLKFLLDIFIYAASYFLFISCLYLFFLGFQLRCGFYLFLLIVPTYSIFLSSFYTENLSLSLPLHLVFSPFLFFKTYLLSFFFSASSLLLICLFLLCLQIWFNSLLFNLFDVFHL